MVSESMLVVSTVSLSIMYSFKFDKTYLIYVTFFTSHLTSNIVARQKRTVNWWRVKKGVPKWVLFKDFGVITI